MSWSSTREYYPLSTKLDGPMVTAAPGSHREVDGTRVERVYFVRRRDVALGSYPYAEPVVLIDRPLAHHYPGIRLLEVIDSPVTSEQAPALRQALPIFAIDWREAAFYPSARAATIARDRRAGPIVAPMSRLNEDGVIR